jgi:capsid protein
MSPLLREGSRTWLGVTLDAGDSVTGYHVKARAVSEDIGARSQHFDVDDLALCFEHLEAGQIRGVSPLAPIVLTLRDLQDAADAERVRMRVAACFSTIIVGEDDDEQDELGPLLTKDGETPVYSMSPAGVYYARGAKDIINPTPQSAGGWKDFDSSHLMRIATGVGLSLDRLSGDLSKSSYSSIRIGDISWRTHVNAFAELFFIPLCLAPIYTWFVTAAVTSGKLPEKALNYAPSWLHPVWQQADTESQYKGAKAKVRCGATSPQRMLAEETGETNWKRIVDETAEFSAYCKQRGVSFETMVEQIAANGQVQSVKGKEPQPTEEPPPAQEPE